MARPNVDDAKGRRLPLYQVAEREVHAERTALSKRGETKSKEVVVAERGEDGLEVFGNGR